MIDTLARGLDAAGHEVALFATVDCTGPGAAASRRSLVSGITTAVEIRLALKLSP